VSPSAVRQAFRSPKPSVAAPKPSTAMRRLGTSGPTTAATMPPESKYSLRIRYDAETPNPQRWFAVMKSADRGNTGPMIDLFHDARLRDTHLRAESGKRTQSMMGRPVTFRPPDGLEEDPEALDNARFVRRIVMNDLRFYAGGGASPLGFRSALQHLMGATVDCYSVARKDWHTNADGDLVPYLTFERGSRFGFDSDTWRLGFYEGGSYGSTRIRPLAEYQDRFIAHIPMNGCSDYPWRRGAMRSCIIPSFIKREDLGFWLTATERLGMAQPYATVPNGIDHDGKPDDDLVAEVQTALLNLSRHWAAVFGEGIKIDSIPGSGDIDPDVYKELLSWADMTISIGMLGQNLSTKVEGGSFAASETHRSVAGDLHLADATELSETVTHQLCEPIIRFNRPGTPVPICEISTAQKQIFKTEHVLSSICSPDELRRSMGHEAQPEGQGAKLRIPEISGGTPGPEPTVDPYAPVGVDEPLAAE